MTDRELDKRAAHRLAVIRHAQEVTGNVSKGLWPNSPVRIGGFCHQS